MSNERTYLLSQNGLMDRNGIMQLCAGVVRLQCKLHFLAAASDWLQLTADRPIDPHVVYSNISHIY